MPPTPAVPPTPGPPTPGPPSPGATGSRERFTVRSVEDLIALVPVVIGFEPEESLTLLSFAARPPGRTFHARVDLPRVGEGGRDGSPDAAELAAVVRSLSDPVAQHRVSLAALVVHSARPELAAAVSRRVARALGSLPPSGVRLAGCLRVHDGRWFRLPGPHGLPGPAPAEGVPYDVALHPFRLRSVVAGRVLHPTRGALAATLERDPTAAAEVRARAAGGPPAGGGVEEAWARRRVQAALGAVDGPGSIDADDAARLLHQMGDVRVRDAAWATMTSANAVRQVELWSDLLRRAPEALLPAPGSLLAFAAWLAGDGALAWCALDRVRAADPDYRLAGLVASLLERACDPGLWVPGGGLRDPWGARPSSSGPGRG